MERGVVMIPARRASTRLPEKLLLAETGRPLLAHVVARAIDAVRRSAGQLTQVVVAADDPELLAIAADAGAKAVLTGVAHRCGTTRLAEALDQLPGPSPAFVVNVQGDEPELAPEAVLRVVRELLAPPGAEMSTLAVAKPAGDAESERMFADPNAVKAILAADGRALCFTRAAAPFPRTPAKPGETLFHHHIGLYAYRTEFLRRFAGLPASPLEERESLEQLRPLESGATIRVGVVPEHWAGKGIDTPADYAAFVHRTAIRRAA